MYTCLADFSPSPGLGRQSHFPRFPILFSPYQPFASPFLSSSLLHIRSGGFTTSVRDGIAPEILNLSHLVISHHVVAKGRC